MYSIGIDIGYSSIKLVIVNEAKEIDYSNYILHKGHVKETLQKAIEELLKNYKGKDIQFGALTGNGESFMQK